MKTRNSRFQLAGSERLYQPITIFGDIAAR